MNKIIYSLIIVFGLTPTLMFAKGTSLGVKAEANLSNAILSEMQNTISSFGAGGNIGGFVKVDLNQWFALQPELMLTLQNTKLETSGVRNNFRTWDVEVPVYALLQLPCSNKGRAYFGIGPYVSYGLDAKNSTTGTNLYSKPDAENSLLSRFNAGFATTIGYEFPNRMQINVSYKQDISNELDSRRLALRNQRASLGVGYRF